MSKPTSQILPTDHITEYNGQKVKWFIGDTDFNNGLWQAWGSCNGHAYQMFAHFNYSTRELSGIKVLPRVAGQDYYFHKETYDLLTK